ncbi:hypothetical protein SPI_04823 [Niveomyces insectorum RCEF 264]|uniref:Uncharacterized protein n=1 Tax=Niveomyces insectorum RCEF 264 TaxID=1081102 RepID=A0A167UW26_9HYPO|nr:hypothetical protein SPI_04823 [Niveomyces insectorum RCEF 264]
MAAFVKFCLVGLPFLLRIPLAGATYTPESDYGMPAVLVNRQADLDSSLCTPSCDLGTCGSGGSCSSGSLVRRAWPDGLSAANTSSGDYDGVNTLWKRLFTYNAGSTNLNDYRPNTYRPLRRELDAYLPAVFDGHDFVNFGDPLPTVSGVDERAVSQQVEFGDNPFQIISARMHGCTVTHLWESYSNGKYTSGDNAGENKVEANDPAFNQRVLMFLRGEPVTNPLPNGYRDYIAPTGPGIDASLFGNQRSDQTQIFVFTPLLPGTNTLKYQARYGNGGEAVSTVANILGVRPRAIIVPYRPLNTGEAAEAAVLGTNALGTVLFQYDPNSDGQDRRRSLWAFSLTSSRCCAAAAARRFRQIHIKIASVDDIKYRMGLAIDVLEGGGYGRQRYVRRLKVSVGTKKEQKRQKRKLEHTEEDEAEIENQNDEDEEDEDDEDEGGRRTHDWTNMHPFCRPPERYGRRRDGVGAPGDPDAWLPVAELVRQLPALRDLVWACASYMPRSVLDAVHASYNCRLHVHNFCLRSLVQDRHAPHPIDPDEYALATSPSLVSIVADLCGIDGFGRIDYTEEGVLRMVAGAAPNLAHVWLTQIPPEGSLAVDEGLRLGRPMWRGFSAGATNEDAVAGGRLQTLVFRASVCPSLDTWCRHIDTRTLRRLTMPCGRGGGDLEALAAMAVRGDVDALDALELSEEHDTPWAPDTLNRILVHLRPLRRLRLAGFVSPETFDVVMHRHGGALRSLELHPYRDLESHDALLVFTTAVAQQLADHCPQLEDIALVIRRLRGGRRETGIYRALSGLPRLRSASLHLKIVLGPDRDGWDYARDGPHPFDEDCERNPAAQPFAYLRDALCDSAVDATLARAIFDVLSRGGSNGLRYLCLRPYLHIAPNDPGDLDPTFTSVVQWLARSWVVRKGGAVTAVRELGKRRADAGGEEWKYLDENKESFWDGEEVYEKVFTDIWPKNTSEWWRDWKSLPLHGSLPM